jgi:hypothetical protein
MPADKRKRTSSEDSDDLSLANCKRREHGKTGGKMIATVVPNFEVIFKNELN